jgi:HEAT repeat protein
MKLMLIAVSLAATMAVQPASTPRIADAYATVPRAAWAQADPADSLYRAARRALTDKDYEAAAKMFDAIVTRFPRSEYAPDALYWKGFALYRNGSLDSAADALEAQAKRYPQAPTRGDAAALLIQIKGQLARRGDASAQRDVNQAASQSGRSCEDMEMQIAALDAVQRMDAERVVPLLKRVLARRETCSVPLRKNALFVLGQRQGSDREKILLDVAKTDPDASVKQDAVFYLQQAKSDAAVEALEDLLLHSDERGVRSNALFALAQNRSERSQKVLRAFALSDGAPVALRNDAIFHIASQPSAETNRFLVSLIVDPKEPMELRKNALFHLASRKSESSTDLSTVYDRVDVAMRKEILFYMAQRSDLLDKMMAIAKSDASPALRKDALFYISQSKDPRVIKFLEDLMNP